MKTAILSDIHSNPVALEKVISDARSHGCAKFICLGDIVGYGYDPNACIDICRKENISCIMGNHDAAIVGRLPLTWFSSTAAAGVKRQLPIISESDKEWLNNLPLQGRICTDRGIAIALSHGTFDFPGRFDYINSPSEAVMEFISLKREGINVLFVGHTHVAEAYQFKENYQVSSVYLDIEDIAPIDLAANPCTIVNVGSCGYPRDQPYSIYCIFDDDKETATHRILEFDFDDYRKKMTSAGVAIPLWLDSKEKRAKERRVEWR